MPLDAFTKDEDEMIDIVVVGYPKSGNTWVTRLIAELAGCPVVGFLGSNHDEIAREGLDRKSRFQCFKSHHQLHELLELNANTKRIIYVIRDPRDICVSGSNYFRFERRSSLGRLFSKLPKGSGVYRRINNSLITPPAFRIERMVQAVLFGSKDVHWWVRVPWAVHYKPYLANQYFFVKYEDLLSHPETECKRIMTFLGIERDGYQIKAAIQRQTFESKKQEFIRRGEHGKAAFMRTGKKEQWRTVLSKRQKKLFNDILTDELVQFGYPTDDGRI